MFYPLNPRQYLTEREISKMVIIYPGKLIRFCFKTLAELLGAFGVEGAVLNYEDERPEGGVSRGFNYNCFHFVRGFYDGLTSRGVVDRRSMK